MLGQIPKELVLSFQDSWFSFLKSEIDKINISDIFDPKILNFYNMFNLALLSKQWFLFSVLKNTVEINEDKRYIHQRDEIGKFLNYLGESWLLEAVDFVLYGSGDANTAMFQRQRDTRGNWHHDSLGFLDFVEKALEKRDNFCLQEFILPQNFAIISSLPQEAVVRSIEDFTNKQELKKKDAKDIVKAMNLAVLQYLKGKQDLSNKLLVLTYNLLLENIGQQHPMFQYCVRKKGSTDKNKYLYYRNLFNSYFLGDQFNDPVEIFDNIEVGRIEKGEFKTVDQNVESFMKCFYQVALEKQLARGR